LRAVVGGAAGLVVGLAVFPGGALAALAIHPTRTDDPSSGGGTCSFLVANNTDCSLRNAIALAGDGTIVSLAPPAPPGPYKVEQSAPLTIAHNLSLVGVGARSSIIEAARPASPVAVLDVTSGVTVGATVQGVTITGGDNNGTGGGGIDNNGALTVRDSTVEGNRTTGTGGGINNTAALTVIGSTISNNTGTFGGGVANQGPSAMFVNTTISDNTAGTTTAGGGINNSLGSTASLANVTLSSNTALGRGGDLYNVGTVSAKDTIIAGGTGSSGTANCADAGVGTMTSGGYNIEDRSQCGLTGTGDQTNTRPLLGALQNNGGPTDTQAPSFDSPAVDRGNPGGCADASNTVLTVDQRGLPRPQGLACDVGAYELQPVAPAVSAALAAGIGPHGATLSGTVDTHGFQTGWHFEYGPTTAYGSSTPTQTFAGGTQPVSAMITGLAPGTTYHFTLVASTSAGGAETADQTFTTGLDAPDVSTGPATGTSTTAATLNGTVIPNGLPTTYQFLYGTTSAFGFTTPVQGAGNGTSSVGASATIVGLAPGTTYHYLLVATNALGTRMGADQTFTTSALATGSAPPPALAPPPVLGPIALVPSAFRAAPGGPSIATVSRTGATVTYTDTQPSITAFTVLQARPGVILGGRCAAPPKRPFHKRGHACTRYVPVGGFTHPDAAGPNRFHFTGRVGGHRLQPGNYQLSAAPQANGTTGKTVSAQFRILR
jgi:hypothetical protein